MFIFKTELKLYFNKTLLITALILLTAFMPAARALGGGLVSGGKLFEKFTVFVADNDNSMESRMLTAELRDFNPDTMNVSLIGENELASAEAAVKNGDAAAVFIIPEDFFKGIAAGENVNATLVLSGQNEAVSAVIRLFADSVAEQLSAAQAGVFFALSNAADEEQFELFVKEVNLSYLSVFMGRSLASEEVSTLYGAVSKADYYLFGFYVFIMSLIPCVFIQNGNIVKSRAFFRMLLSKGVSVNYIFISKLLSVAAVFLALNLPFSAFLILKTHSVSASLTLFASAVLAQSAYCTAVIWFFEDIKAAGVFIFLAGLFALFFSGGVIPLVFLPRTISGIGLITPNYHLASLFADASKGVVSNSSVLFIMLFAILALTASYVRAKFLSEEI